MDMRRVAGRVQGGFTLVEVLVTALVMGVGLLGLAGLQLAGMKSNYSAFLRTEANFAAYDLLDRMRADPGAFVGRTLTFDPDVDSGKRSFEGWEAILSTLPLPAPVVAADAPEGADARGAVDCADGNACGDGNCAILVRWDDSRGERWDQEEAIEDQRTAALEFLLCSRIAQ